jgi:isovaleryl-CoA dehydrogenase
MTMTAELLPQQDPQDVQSRYAELARRHVAGRSAQAYEAEVLDRLAWRRLAAAGLWRVGVPRHLGGYGQNWRELGLAITGIARGSDDLGFTLSLIAHAGLVRALVRHGTSWHHQHVLPSLMSGAIGATALTETHGGSDVARTRTTATRSGDGWLLTGSKDHITNAPVADRALILGRIPALGRRDITLFVVNLHAPGVGRGNPEQLLGLRTSPTGALRFDQVAVPEAAVLGRPGDGLTTLYDIISFDRALYGLAAAGYLEPRLDRIIDFAQQRMAFGQPIIDHQYVQGRITDIRIAIEVARATALAGIDALADDDPGASLRCSVAKLVGSEGLVTAAQDIMRLQGHVGYMRGAASRDVQDALGTLIAGGTSEMQRKNILNQILAARAGA